MYMLIRRTTAITLPILTVVLMPQACAEGIVPIVENMSMSDSVSVDTLAWAGDGERDDIHALRLDRSKMINSTEKGECKWPHDATFDEECSCIEWHGQGKISYDDGSEYVGEWLSNDMCRVGQRCGKGICKWSNAAAFDGDWSIHMPHGNGNMNYEDGSNYIGEWLEGKRHGRGILKRANRDGEWSTNEQKSRDKWRIYLSLALVCLIAGFLIWVCTHVRLSDIKDYVAFYVYVSEHGETVEALSPKFDNELKSSPKPKLKPTRQKVISQQPFWTDNSSLTKKEMSGPSRRRKCCKLPLSISGSEKIDGNSPGGGNDKLGVRVEKLFLDEDTGKPRLFSGIVTAHDAKYDFYKVSYEDGDEEEVTPSELEEILASKVSGTAVRDGGTRKRKRPRATKNHSIL